MQGFSTGAVIVSLKMEGRGGGRTNSLHVLGTRVFL